MQDGVEMARFRSNFKHYFGASFELDKFLITNIPLYFD